MTPERESFVTRDELDRVLCPHGRPIACQECGEEYAIELDRPIGKPTREWLENRLRFYEQHTDKQANELVEVTIQRDKWLAAFNRSEQFQDGPTKQRDALRVELLLAADTFRDFSAVLRVVGKDVMSAAADVAERHIREQLAAIYPSEQ